MAKIKKKNTLLECPKRAKEGIENKYVKKVAKKSGKINKKKNTLLEGPKRAKEGIENK